MQPSPPAPAPANRGTRKKVIAAVLGTLVGLIAVVSVVAFYLTPSETGDVIRLGFSIALSGRYSVEGTNSLHGIKTMTEWINTHGGILVGGKSYRLVLNYYDDTSVSTQISPLYTRIVAQDGAHVLLAPYSSALTTAAAPLADQLDRVMLSHGGASDAIWTKPPGYRNLVMVLSPASVYLRGPIDWLAATHPLDKVAIVHENDAFSTVAAQSAIAYAASRDINVVYNDSYPSNPNDLTSVLTFARNAGADALIGGGHFQDGLLIMNQLNTIGWRPKFVSLLVAVTEHTFEAQLGALSNNVTGPSQWESSVGYGPAVANSLGIPWFGPTPAEFTSLYRNLTVSPSTPSGLSPTYHSGEAAAAVIVMKRAIETANSLNTSAIRNALAEMRVMTFFGEFQVNSIGLQTAHSMVMVQWHEGSLKVVWPSAVAEAPVRYPYTGS